MHDLGMAVTLMLKSQPQIPRQYQDIVIAGRLNLLIPSKGCSPLSAQGQGFGVTQSLTTGTECVLTSTRQRKPCSSIYLVTRQDGEKKTEQREEHHESYQHHVYGLCHQAHVRLQDVVVKPWSQEFSVLVPFGPM